MPTGDLKRESALAGVPHEPIGFAIVGGMFDPPHIGHVAAVDHACGWGRVLSPAFVVVGGNPPHRTPPVATPHDRLEMTRAAFAGRDWVQVSDVEIVRAGRGATTWMIDTVDELIARMPGRTPYLVLGDDRAATLPTWHRWPELLERVELLVVTRHLAGDVTEDPAIRRVRDALAGQVIHWCPMSAVNASSSEVRQLVRDGRIEAAQALVPAGVAPLLEAAYATARPAGMPE